MDGPAFSIIIPHRDTPELLRRLLQSVPWSLGLQVIVVDDDSTEAHYGEVQRLAGEYGFELYQVCGHSAGAARNAALTHAQGCWLVFADADDYFMPDAATLLAAHADDGAEVVYFGVESRYSDDGTPAYRDRQVTRLMDMCDKRHSLDALRALHTNPWGKMIRRELVEREGICFEEIPSANDAFFSVRCGVKAREVMMDRRKLYCITVSGQSLTSNMSRERFESNGQARLRVNRYLRRHGLGRYQLSVLHYFLLSWRYGLRAGAKATRDCLRDGNNPLVGLSALISPERIRHSLMSRPKK